MKQQLVEMFDVVHDMKIKVKNEIGRLYFTLWNNVNFSNLLDPFYIVFEKLT